jgi:phosphoribosylglycinamide formyltransferase-1
MRMARKRIAILISGRGSNMAALIDAASDRSYPADIALVLSNSPDAGGLSVAQSKKIKIEVVDHKRFGKDRDAFEREVQSAIDANKIDYVCLAGFMRLLTPSFVWHWHGRMLNIHPALLPSFKGLDTHERAIAEGVKIHGATVHFVVPEVDSGPIIVQAAVPVLTGDTPQSLAARVIQAEHRIYPLALRWLCEGKLKIVDGRCVIDGASDIDGMLISPTNLRLS